MSFPIHPLIFAIFPVIFLFSLNINSLNHEEVIIPIIIVPVISLALWGLLSLVLKNSLKAGMIISVGILVFFTYGHIHNILIESDIAGDFSRHRYLLIPFFMTFVISTIYFVRTNRLLDNTTKIINGVSIAIILITLVNVASFSISETSISTENENQETNLVYHTSVPDIYLIVLDGYAGETILNSVYDYDNSEFLKSLEKYDFHIIENAKSNYPITTHTFSSMLNLKYINYVGDELGKDSKNIHPLTNMIVNNKVVQDLKSLGYKTIVLGSSVKFTTDLSEADLILCRNNDKINSEFNISLFKTSIMKPIYSLLFESHRDKTLCSLSELPNVHNKFDEPTFVLAHFLLPHPPNIFGPNGEEVEVKTIEVTDSWGDKEGYIDQVKFSNKKMLEFIESIPLDNNSPIIIIMGDHGTGSTGLISDDQKIKERMMILNAIRLPGIEEKPYDGMTPVNTFRLIFNSYFGGNYEYLEDKTYLSQHSAPYNFTDVTEKLN